MSLAVLALSMGIPLLAAEAVQTIGAGAAFISGASVTGAAFAGGAEAFQSTERAIRNKIAEDKMTKGERRIRDNNNPFAENRFLNDTERRELSQKILNQIKD
jgi:hypothetical protein